MVVGAAMGRKTDLRLIHPSLPMRPEDPGYAGSPFLHMKEGTFNERPTRGQSRPATADNGRGPRHRPRHHVRHAPHDQGTDQCPEHGGGLRFHRLRRTSRPHPGLDPPARRQTGGRGPGRLPPATGPDRRPKARVGRGGRVVGPSDGPVASDLGHPCPDRREGQGLRRAHQGHALQERRPAAPPAGCPFLQRRAAALRRGGRPRRPAVQGPMGDDARRPGVLPRPCPQGPRGGRRGHREHGRRAHAVPRGRGAAHARPPAVQSTTCWAPAATARASS